MLRIDRRAARAHGNR